MDMIDALRIGLFALTAAIEAGILLAWIIFREV